TIGFTGSKEIFLDPHGGSAPMVGFYSLLVNSLIISLSSLFSLSWSSWVNLILATSLISANLNSPWFSK
ncbi:hypothetical protein, partial [Aeromonas salmonicida]